MSAKRILVVDDEKNQREILQIILSGERDDGGNQLYEVKSASSGQEALRSFKNENFDLVLTDLKMAGMDGIQLLNELSQLDSSTPVILMTAHGSIDTVKEALRGGAFDYLENRSTARSCSKSSRKPWRRCAPLTKRSSAFRTRWSASKR